MQEETVITNPEEVKASKPKQSPSGGMPDNAIMKWFIGAASIAFFVTLILWTASLTMGIMDIVLPHNPAAKYYALALFDGGVLVWLGIYAYKARGVPQHGVSLLMFMLDLLGVVLMTIGGVYMGGQALKDIPAWLGGALINGVIFATLANVTAAYYYKISDPETRESMQAQSLEDTLSEEAMRQARASVEREARHLGSIMARRATARIKYRLALPMTEHERAEWDGETIEGTAEDVPALPSPSAEIPAWLLGVVRFFGRRQRQAQSQQNADTTTTSSNP